MSEPRQLFAHEAWHGDGAQLNALAGNSPPTPALPHKGGGSPSARVMRTEIHPPDAGTPRPPPAGSSHRPAPARQTQPGVRAGDGEGRDVLAAEGRAVSVAPRRGFTGAGPRDCADCIGARAYPSVTA